MKSRIGLCVLIFALAGCGRTAPPALPSGPTSAPGWDIRYNAVLALAHRGSAKLAEPHVQELLNEILDEDQQLRNFKSTLKNGTEVADPSAARTAVLGGIKALNQYCALKGPTGLQPFKTALEKLSQSSTRALAHEASELLTKINGK